MNGISTMTSGSKVLTAGANTTLLNVSSAGGDLEDIAIFIRYVLMQNQGGTLKYEYGTASMGYRADANGGAVTQATKFGNSSIGPPIVDFYGAQFGSYYIINVSTPEGNTFNKIAYEATTISLSGGGNEAIVQI